MIYVAILLILAGIFTVKFAFSDKSDKYNDVMIGGKKWERRRQPDNVYCFCRLYSLYYRWDDVERLSGRL